MWPTMPGMPWIADASAPRAPNLGDATAQCEHHPGRLLVRFRASTTARGRERAYAAIQGARLRKIEMVPGLEVVSTRLPVSRALALTAASGDVAYVEPDCIYRTDALPNDPGFGDQWGLRNTGQTGGTAGADVHAQGAWDVRTDAGSVVVAVIDTGIQLNHPDLSANIWINTGETAGNGIDDDHNGYVDDRRGWDFVNGDSDPSDDHFHGTHVAGVIGARGNNGVGISGMAWAVKLMPLKAFDAAGIGYVSTIVGALSYAVAKGAKLSNNSYSGSFTRSIYDAFVAAGAAGHLAITAAGNSATNADAAPEYPGAFRLASIISVAATDHDDQLASFSNYGAINVHVAAPGETILSTVPGSGYGTASGTSMAAPHVSGLAALLLAQNPAWNAASIRNRILGTTRPVAGLVGKTWTGGIIDAAKALSGAATVLPPATPPFTASPLATSLVPEPDPDPVAAPAPPVFPDETIVDATERHGFRPVRIRLDGAGRPVVAYNRDFYGIELATLNAGSWSFKQLTSPYREAGNLELTFDRAGAATVATQRAWTDLEAYSDPGIVIARDGSPASEERITAACPDADTCFRDWSPMIERDASGDLHVLFVRAPTGGEFEDEIAAPGGSAPSVTGSGLYYAHETGGGWEVVRLTTFDGESSTGLDVAPDGTVHIVVRRVDGSASGLYHVTNAGGTWSIRRLTDQVEDLSVDVAVDAAGVAHVAIARHGYGLYVMSRSTGGTWTGPTRVFDGNAFETEVVVDAAGKLHVVFGLGDDLDTASGVRYATNASGAWAVSTIANGQAASPSLAVDGAGKAHIAFYRAAAVPWGVLYATNATGSFVTSTVRTLSAYGNAEAMAYARDGAGYGHIAVAAHFGESNAGIYYGTDRSGSWSFSRVYSGWPNALGLAVDAGGHPSIAFAETMTQVGAPLGTAATLGYLTNVSGSWVVEKIATSGDFAPYDVAITLDAGEQPHVAYVGGLGQRTLYHAHRGTGAWTRATVATATGYVQQPTILVDPAGVVHIAAGVQQSGQSGTAIVLYRGSGSSWTSSAGTSASQFNVDPSIGRTSDGTIWIAASRNDEGIWVHRRTSGGSWSSAQLADEPGDAFPTLTVDAAGRVAVAYGRRTPYGQSGCSIPQCASGGGLRLARLSGGIWSTERLTPYWQDFQGLVARGGDGSLGVVTNRLLVGTRSVEPDPGSFTGTVMLRPSSDSGISATDGLTNATSLTFDVTLDRPVTGLAAGDFSRTGTATGCTVGAPTGSGRSFQVTLTGCSAGTVALSLLANSVVDGLSAVGPVANASARTVTVDRTAPTVAVPVVTLRTGASLASASATSGLLGSLAWTATDPGSGVASYDVARSDNGAAFSSIANATTATSMNVSMTPAHTYRYEVRARDKAGNLSSYRIGPSLKPSRVQGGSSAIKKTGTWSTGTSASYSNGTVKFAKAAGASATYTFTGRGIAFVTTKRSTAGKVKVYLDGVLITTIDTYAATTTYRFVAFAKTWTSVGTHTLKLVVSGTAGRPRVDLDALEVIR